jgi:ubiquitin-protein ligase E3 A
MSQDPTAPMDVSGDSASAKPEAKPEANPEAKPETNPGTQSDPKPEDKERGDKRKEQAASEEKAKTRERFQRFLKQLTEGCGRRGCTNVDCASCPGCPKRAKKEAVVRVFQLVQNSDSELCPEDVTTQLRRLAISKDDDQAMIKRLATVFADFDQIKTNFWEQVEGKTDVNEMSPGIDVALLDELHAIVSESPEASRALATALLTLTTQLASSSPKDVPLLTLRSYAVLLEIRSFLDPAFNDAFKQLAKAVTSLPNAAQEQIWKWMSRYDLERLEFMVSAVQQYITVRWYTSRLLDDIMHAVRLLKILHEANKIKERTDAPALPFDMFYNDAVNTELDIKNDYKRWKNGSGFAFASAAFIFDPAAKAQILQFDAAIQMSHQFEEAFLQSLHTRESSPYLILKVNRQNILHDTLQQIQRMNSSDFKKPLKVKFEGEEGIDEGGVQKEFFQILISELFDPKFGMLVYDDETKTLWFNKDSLESSMEFELMGILLGLAIYNGIILDLHFPEVVYKKLMGHKPTLRDLQNTKPDLARGLVQLLNFTGNVAETYLRHFTYTYEAYGEEKSVELKPGGGEIELTNDNREEYVQLTIDYLLTKSIAKQYKAFSEGFLNVCEGDPLKMFRYEELQLLVCGSPNLDFKQLEEVTRYDDGFTAESPVIVHFWQIVHDMSLEDKKKLLSFCTGSDRVPIKGLGHVSFTISKNGPDSDRLPISHTCFNHLLLPEYGTKEKLYKSLQVAIQNSKGFGMI